MSLQEILQKLLILKLQIQVLVLKQKRTIPDLPNPRFIIIHHGAGPFDFKQVNNHHKNRWGFKSSLGYYAGYQLFIEYSGKTYQARADNEEGAHTIGNVSGYFNKCSIGICLQGNSEKEHPTYFQLDVLKGLIDKKQKEYNIPNDRVYGHRRVFNTLCPGKYLYQWLVGNYPD